MNQGQDGSGQPVTAWFFMVLSAPSGKEVLVDWGTAVGEPGPGMADHYDFTDADGQLHFLPQGDPWDWVAVTVANDEIYEPDPEVFYVKLTSASNARISNEHN